MKKYFFILVIILCLLMIGCTDGSLSGSKPPKVYIKISDTQYETVLGTYCWKECADTVGPVQLFEGKEPIKVNPGEEITIIMDYEPKPSESHLSIVNEKSDSIKTEVLSKENEFSAPSEKGIYYYSYGVWWMDEEEEHVSHGDAFYAFAIEVE